MNQCNFTRFIALFTQCVQTKTTSQNVSRIWTDMDELWNLLKWCHLCVSVAHLIPDRLLVWVGGPPCIPTGGCYHSKSHKCIYLVYTNIHIYMYIQIDIPIHKCPSICAYIYIYIYIYNWKIYICQRCRLNTCFLLWPPWSLRWHIPPHSYLAAKICWEVARITGGLVYGNPQQQQQQQQHRQLYQHYQHNQQQHHHSLESGLGYIVIFVICTGMLLMAVCLILFTMIV